MSFLVVSDLHGAVTRANMIPELLIRHNAEMLILLGDLLYHGPRNPLAPSYDAGATAEALNALTCRILAVRGNCDSEVDLCMLNFPVIDEFSWIFTDQLKIFVSHGHKLTANPPVKAGDVCLYGHTHKPEADSRGGANFWNPGSITLPKNGHPPSYGLIQGNTFKVLNLDGEVYMEGQAR